MLRGVMRRAAEMAGTAVLRIVVSSDSMKNATATSHGRSLLAAFEGTNEDGGAIDGRGTFIRETSAWPVSTYMVADAPIQS
jgi:hypothetical protein